MPQSYVLAEVPIESKIKGVYEPKGAAKYLWNCKDQELIIEGPAETGKTLAVLHKLDALAWKYPGMQGMILRKTYTSMPGSVLQTYIMKVLGQMTSVSIIQNYELPRAPDIGIYGGNRPEEFKYPNGSIIWIAGMDKPEKALSQERDIIYVNQCEELSLAEWETLTTRATGRAGNIPHPQLIGDCNPSAPTHWILSRERLGHVKLLHSKHKDNPMLWDEEKQSWTMQGYRSMAVLNKLSGSRRARLLEGLWVIPEGAIYEQFSEEENQIAAFTPPSHWPRIVGVDPTGAYVGALWLAYDPTNYALHVYREYLQPYGLTTGGHAQNILELCSSESIWRWFGGGPSERQQRTDYLGWGLPLEAPLVTDVWASIDRVQQLFQARALFIHSCCLGLLSELGTYRRVTDKNGNPTESIQDKNDYHLLDCLRYAVVGLLGSGEEEEQQLVYSPIKIGVDY
jgi:phage terminase large subunit